MIRVVVGKKQLITKKLKGGQAAKNLGSKKKGRRKTCGRRRARIIKTVDKRASIGRVGDRDLRPGKKGHGKTRENHLRKRKKESAESVAR